MDSREFFNKVVLMRQLQQEYLRTGSRFILAILKDAEREVDADIKHIDAIMWRKQKKQKLFK